MPTLAEYTQAFLDYGWIDRNEATGETRVRMQEGVSGTPAYSDLCELEDAFGGRVYDETGSSRAEWIASGYKAEEFLRIIRPWVGDDQGWLDEIAKYIDSAAPNPLRESSDR